MSQPVNAAGAALPRNVSVGEGTVISGDGAFKRFASEVPDGILVGAHSTMDGVQFAVGPRGRISVGSYCYFTNAVLMAELELVIGDYVMIGFNTTIADTDFHPVAPALRIEDAIACSPLGGGRPRPPVACLPVVIEDTVWIGPNVTILKGVRIGAGAWLEPGAVVTEDVPAGARVIGNPARVVGRG